MGEVKYIKTNSLLLLGFLPLFVVGYIFASGNESLFFIYEGLLILLIVLSIGFSIWSMFQIESNLKWIPISFLAFLIQFSVLSLFLGPFTEYALFYMYFPVAIFSVAVFLYTIKKVERFKYIPIIFTILTIPFVLYMFFLMNLWGKDLT